MSAELHSAELVFDIEGAEPVSPLRCVIAWANHFAPEGLHVSAEHRSAELVPDLDSAGPVFHR